jgi:TPP-dependent trihydroxycyclohexane-1,2-dione (THcHDO) dehydratase
MVTRWTLSLPSSRIFVRRPGHGKKEQRSARLAIDAREANKAADSSVLIIDLKARYAGVKKSQEQVVKEKQDTILEMQALGASKTMVSSLLTDANLKAKRMGEKVESLKTQVKGYKEHAVVGLDGTQKDNKWQCKPTLIPSIGIFKAR